MAYLSQDKFCFSYHLSEIVAYAAHYICMNNKETGGFNICSITHHTNIRVNSF